MNKTTILRIANKHTPLIVNLLITSINIMSRLYSFPVFGFVDSHIAVYNYRVRNQARKLSRERGKVVVLKETELEIKQENYRQGCGTERE